jgi:MFS family permease
MILAIRSRFFKLLGINIQEKNKVYWSLFLVFSGGALQCYISAFPIAIFISIFGSKNLPQIYLAVAGFSILMGVLYSFFESRFKFNQLILGLICTIGTFLTMLSLGIIHWGDPWLVVLLLIWAILSYDLLDLAIWAILNRIYTLQQAKSSFGIIGGFQSLGGLIGGLLSPILVLFIRLEYLLLMLGVLTFVVMVIMFYLLKNTDFQTEDLSEQDSFTPEIVDIEKQLKFKSFFKNRYVLKIFSLVTLGVFAMYTIDLLFNTAAEEKYPTDEALAAFMGIFYGLVDGLDLFTSVFVFNWFLKKFGLVPASFVLPTISLIIITPLLILLQVPGFFITVFWLITALKLFEECLRGSLSDMSILLLLQPFHPRVRSNLQAKIDSTIVGISTAIISLILILIASTIGVSTSLLAVLAMFFFIGQFLINLTLKNNYIDALSKAIAKRYYARGGSLKPTREDLLILKKYLNSNHPDEIIYALLIIEKIDKNTFVNALAHPLHSRSTFLVEFTLDKIMQYHLNQYEAVLEKILKSHPVEEIQAKALFTLGHINYSKIKPTLAKFLKNPESILGLQALTLINQFESSKGKIIVYETIMQMCKSPLREARRESARLIGVLNHDKFTALLNNLSVDKDEQVRVQALQSVIKLGYQELFDDVCKNIINIPLNLEILNDLKKHQDIFTKLIMNTFQYQSAPCKIKYLHILKHYNNLDAQNFIKTLIFTEKSMVKQLSLTMLVDMKFPYDEKFYKNLSQEILTETSFLRTQYEYLLTIPQLELTQLLTNIISSKLKLSSKRLILSLAIYYDNATIMKVRDGLEQIRENERDYAIELLHSSLEADHKKVIIPLFMKIYLNKTDVKFQVRSEFVQVLREHLQPNIEDNFDLATLLASIYIVMHGEYPELNDELHKLSSHPSPIIQETLAWGKMRRVKLT